MATAKRELMKSGRHVWQIVGLLSLILLSALAVIHSSHACRKLYEQLQVEEASQWHLQEEYSRLLLEQSMWASYQRIDKVARDELGMQVPALTELQVVHQ